MCVPYTCKRKGNLRVGALWTREGDCDRSRQASVVGGGSNVRVREGSPRKIEYCIEPSRIDFDDQ